MHQHEELCPACPREAGGDTNSWKEKKTYLIVASAIILAAGLTLKFMDPILGQILLVTVLVISGYEIAKNGFLSLLKKRLDINMLMIVAAIGAFLIGHGEEGATIVLLFSVAEFLEERAGERRGGYRRLDRC